MLGTFDHRLPFTAFRKSRPHATSVDELDRLPYYTTAMWIEILLVSVICFLVNIPLGRMRERSRKFSWQWILWIHASIPVIIALRFWLGLHPIAIPINIAAAVLGQFLGGLPEKKKRQATSPTAVQQPPSAS